MPRYYRRRYSRRTFRKRNWASNIITSSTSLTIPSNSTYGAGSAICLNPVQSVATVSQPFTVKNIKLSITADAPSINSTIGIDNLIAAICYVPQGYTVSYSTLSEHPEWFMAVKYLDEPLTISNSASNPIYYSKPFTVSTRLARKLQTGDSIQLCFFGQNINTANDLSVRFKFMAQWWTCAN